MKWRDEKKYHTRNKSWFGLRGSVWSWIIRFPVKVYNELFGCSHWISPASCLRNYTSQIITKWAISEVLQKNMVTVGVWVAVGRKENIRLLSFIYQMRKWLHKRAILPSQLISSQYKYSPKDRENRKESLIYKLFKQTQVQGSITGRKKTN
jgi:hypothetical protein